MIQKPGSFIEAQDMRKDFKVIEPPSTLTTVHSILTALIRIQIWF